MYVQPVVFSCPIGPYPYCIYCRHYYACPYFPAPPGFPVIPVIPMPPAQYPRDQFCQRCGHALTWIPYAQRWLCPHCGTYL